MKNFRLHVTYLEPQVLHLLEHCLPPMKRTSCDRSFEEYTPQSFPYPRFEVDHK